MNINRDNYEEYFLDYMEGNLEQSLYNELLDFLNSNPDLKDELSLIQGDEVILSSESNINFPDKESLKKDSGFNTNELIIASIEGDLSNDENQDLLNRIEEDLELKDDYIQFKKTKLRPDYSITYSDKASLKRSIFFGIRRKTVLSFISAAASIILLFSVYYTFNSMFSLEERQYTERTEKEDVLDNNPTPMNTESQLAEVVKPLESADKPEKEKKSGENSTALPDEKNKKAKTKTARKVGKIIKSVDPISAKRDSLTNKLKKISPKKEKVQVDRRSTRTKPILKPVEIQSQGLLAQAPAKNEEYLSVKELLGKRFKKNVLKNDSTSSYSLNAWDIADAGIQGINKITGGELELKRKYDDEGAVVAYSLFSNKFSFEKGVKSSQ